jgi:uncharacterized protein
MLGRLPSNRGLLALCPKIWGSPYICSYIYIDSILFWSYKKWRGIPCEHVFTIVLVSVFKISLYADTTLMTTFDPVKDEINARKHGIALSAAVDFEWDTCVSYEDRDESYGEHRKRAIGYLKDRLHLYVYTLRGEEDHAISLRRATKQEMRYYVENR